MRGLIALATLATVPLACVSAFATPVCPFDGSALAGGQVYYVDGKQVVALSATTLLEGGERKRFDLYYVVRSGATDRSGLIVVKSARFGTALADDDPKSDSVSLRRLEASRQCDPDKGSFRGSVSNGAYGEYHDYGQDNGNYLRAGEGGVTAKQKLQKFHTKYVAGFDRACRSSDAKTRNDGSYEARSNRSQFSFDTDIVDHGFNPAIYNVASQTFTAGWQFLFPTAYAEPQTKLRERRVEIKRYRTANGHACVPFSIEVRGPVQVLRVNDLEASRTDNYAHSEFRLGPWAKP
jgi:hypothetical protein